MKFFIFLMLISNHLYSMIEYTLPTITVVGIERSGYEVAKQYTGTFEEDVILLACYINTQSVGDHSDHSLHDKYGVAKVSVNRAKYDNINIRDYVMDRKTVKLKLNNRFKLNSFDKYHSRIALVVARQVLLDNIPTEFDVGIASNFWGKHVKYDKKKWIVITTVKHVFLISRRRYKRINKNK